MSGNRLSSKLRPMVFSKYDIALFIDAQGKTRWSHLLKAFVENGSDRHISRQRLSDYLKELCNEGLVNKTIDKKALMFRMYWRVYPIYLVPKNRKKRIAEIRARKRIYEFVDSADPKKLEKLGDAIKSIEDSKG